MKKKTHAAKFSTFASKAEEIDGWQAFHLKNRRCYTACGKVGVEFLSNKLGESVIVLANSKTVIAKVSDSFVKKGVNAGKIVGEIARATVQTAAGVQTSRKAA